MISWPEILVKEIARRRCVIVVGSGVSAQAKAANGISPPTWKDFLTNCNEKLVVALAKISQMLSTKVIYYMHVNGCKKRMMQDGQIN